MKNTINIDGREIGDGKPVFIISEAGVNHNGSVDVALQLIEASAKCGANCVKFQTFRADRVAMDDAPKAAYQLEVTEKSESQIDMLRALELPEHCYPDLMKACKKAGIIFLSTPYNEEDVDFLVEIGAPALKLASIHAAEPSMLRYAANTGLPLIVSTGMATHDEVAMAVETVRATGNNRFALLQCTTNYPSAPADANLKAMVTMRESFGIPVGYSDHTDGDTTAIAAVALGACVLEKHFTIDPGMPGPDQSTSLDQGALSRYVNVIRVTESSLGTGIKAPAEKEKRNIEGMRRSIVVRQDLPAGHLLKERDLILKRPATGIIGKHWDAVIGTRTKRGIAGGAQLSWPDLDTQAPTE